MYWTIYVYTQTHIVRLCTESVYWPPDTQNTSCPVVYWIGVLTSGTGVTFTRFVRLCTEPSMSTTKHILSGCALNRCTDLRNQGNFRKVCAVVYWTIYVYTQNISCAVVYLVYICIQMPLKLWASQYTSWKALINCIDVASSQHPPIQYTSWASIICVLPFNHCSRRRFCDIVHCIFIIGSPSTCVLYWILNGHRF